MSLANVVPRDQFFVPRDQFFCTTWSVFLYLVIRFFSYHLIELRTVKLSRRLSTNSVNPGKTFAEKRLLTTFQWKRVSTINNIAFPIIWKVLWSVLSLVFDKTTISTIEIKTLQSKERTSANRQKLIVWYMKKTDHVVQKKLITWYRISESHLPLYWFP